MKKVVSIAICTLGIIILSSCRSTANRCGLAENQHQIQQNIQQDAVIVIKATV